MVDNKNNPRKNILQELSKWAKRAQPSKPILEGIKMHNKTAVHDKATVHKNINARFPKIQMIILLLSFCAIMLKGPTLEG